MELTSTAAETEAVGARLAAGLRPGDVVLVSGELGAGKTTLVRGALRHLGIAGPVVSPTFTIGRRYEGTAPIAHLDLFRLGSLEGEEPGFMDDYLRPDTIAFVEWPAILEPELPADLGSLIRVRIQHRGGDDREIAIARREPAT